MKEKKDRLYNVVKEKLEMHGQQHLIDHYAELGEQEREELLRQLDAIPFETIKKMYQDRDKKQDDTGITEPMEVMTLDKIKENKMNMQSIGLEEVRNGRVAIVLLAGGQATRLGLYGPKGMLDLGITKHLYLFEIIIMKLLETEQKTGTYVDLYIMTNEKDELEVKDFFKQNQFFGYPEIHVIFFRQEMLPKLLLNGKMILEDRSHVAAAPCGNGAWLDALEKNHLIKKMQEDGIRFINLLSIDNPLYQIVDFSFLGALIAQNAQMGVQVVEKNSPYEKVGVICKRNGKPAVKEYYEMTKEEQESRNADNQLCYRYGVILNYLFRIEEVTKWPVSSLPVHFAKKKMSYVKEDGTKFNPDSENGYVMERLALDMISKNDRVLAYEVERETNFAPVKNKTGIDSIDSARELLKRNGYQL